jgi:carbonic anhydrase
MRVSLLFQLITVLGFTNYIHSYISWLVETPDQWPGICQTGKSQSPINIQDQFSLYNTNPVVKILSTHYNATLMNPITLSIVNNKSFAGDLTGKGYIMVLKNNITYKYNSVNFHIHSQSEHTFGGVKNDLEMHIVHSKDNDYLTNSSISNDPDAVNQLLVIGVRINAAGNSPNDNYNQMMIPNGPTMMKFDIDQYMPIGKPFFHYEGSLTTPGCNETVNWIVNKEIVLISQMQLIATNTWIAKGYEPQNARMTKPLNGRQIFYQYYPEQVVSTNGSFTTFNMFLLICLMMSVIFN